MTLLDGLSGGRWAIAAKVHHCLVDGISGTSVTSLILDTEPEPGAESGGLLAGFEPPPDNERGAHGPLGLAYEGARAGLDLALHPAQARRCCSPAHEAWPSCWSATSCAARRSTSLNVRIGATRRLAEVPVPLEELKAIKRGLGGTVNDVVLAAVGGRPAAAARVPRRGAGPEGLRAMVPVSLRADERDAGARQPGQLALRRAAGRRGGSAGALPQDDGCGRGAEGRLAGRRRRGVARPRRDRAARAPRRGRAALLYAAPVQRHDHQRPGAPDDRSTRWARGFGGSSRWCRSSPTTPSGSRPSATTGSWSSASTPIAVRVPDLDVLARGIEESLEELRGLAQAV